MSQLFARTNKLPEFIPAGFCSMKWLGALLLPPGWDATPSQVIPPKFVKLPQHFAGTQLHTPGGTVRVNNLSQEQNAVSLARGHCVQLKRTERRNSYDEFQSILLIWIGRGGLDCQIPCFSKSVVFFPRYAVDLFPSPCTPKCKIGQGNSDPSLQIRVVWKRVEKKVHYAHTSKRNEPFSPEKPG